MEKVQGFGGVFFRAEDPKAMADWYEKYLSVLPVPTDAESEVWMQEAGPTVFSPFSADTDYFAADRKHMVNFRVGDLDKMVGQLAAAGIEISHREDMEGVGRFARIHDPEGNLVELWQPG